MHRGRSTDRTLSTHLSTRPLVTMLQRGRKNIELELRGVKSLLKILELPTVDIATGVAVVRN